MASYPGPYRITRCGPSFLWRLFGLLVFAVCVLGCDRSVPPAEEHPTDTEVATSEAPDSEPLPEPSPASANNTTDQDSSEAINEAVSEPTTPEPSLAAPLAPHPPLRLIVNGRTITRPLMSVSLLPRQRLSITIDNAQASHDFLLLQTDQDALPAEENEWLWRAPKNTGLQSLTIKSVDGSANIKLQVFVLTAFTQIDEDEEDLNGYMIGEYPDDPEDDNPIYLPPDGFIEVTPDNEETWVSPHFQLKQFLCKQKGGYPKYVVLQTALLQKLEAVIEHLANRGYSVNTLKVMSGYRTPEYNDDIGNSDWSRHVWGDAADVYIDQNNDDQMDDIDGDGKTTDADVRLFYNLVNEMDNLPEYASQIGGLGYYGAKSWRTGFIHIDTRGSKARW